MGGSRMFVWLSLVLTLATGCPLEDDPVEDGRSNASPADGGGTGNQNNGGAEPGNTGDTGDDNSSDNGDDDASNGTDNNGGSGGDGGVDLDAGSTGELDAGGGGLDASASSGSDASASTGTDAATSADAGPADAGMSEPDSHVEEEEDAGPPIVVPDLGAADLPDAERVTLIVNYLTSEGYTDTWYPELQGEAVERPLIVSPSHGTSVRPFQNAVSKQALDAWVEGGLPLPLDMPNGSVIVKESFKIDAMTQQSVPNGKLIMAKIDALDPATYEGNWFYMRITTAGVAARATTCVDCHNGRKATGAWPVNAETNPTGGNPNALVPYDYLFVPYCYDSRTPECAGPN